MQLKFEKHIENYLTLFPDLNSEELSFLASYLTIEKFPKKTFLFKERKLREQARQNLRTEELTLKTIVERTN